MGEATGMIPRFLPRRSAAGAVVRPTTGPVTRLAGAIAVAVRRTGETNECRVRSNAIDDVKRRPWSGIVRLSPCLWGIKRSALIEQQVRVRIAPGDDTRREPQKIWMEDSMPRHFGLKATSAAGRSAFTGSSRDLQQRTASAAASKNQAAASAPPASKLSSAPAELPYSPASWRGCRGRRSISVD